MTILRINSKITLTILSNKYGRGHTIFALFVIVVLICYAFWIGKNQEILKAFTFGEVFETNNRRLNKIPFHFKQCKKRSKDPLPKDFQYLKRLEKVFISLRILFQKRCNYVWDRWIFKIWRNFCNIPVEY